MKSFSDDHVHVDEIEGLRKKIKYMNRTINVLIIVSVVNFVSILAYSIVLATQ